jgi:hypothetical protein
LIFFRGEEENSRQLVGRENWRWVRFREASEAGESGTGEKCLSTWAPTSFEDEGLGNVIFDNGGDVTKLDALTELDITGSRRRVDGRILECQ